MSAESKKAIASILIPVAFLVSGIGMALFAMKYSLDTHPPGTVPQTTEIRLGATLPDFKLTPFSTEERIPPAPMSKQPGKVHLINFWATWCAPCLIEMPSIQKLWEKYKKDGLNVIAISVDETPEQLIPGTLRKINVNLPIYTDPGQELGRLFQISGLPFTLILNENREILYFEAGERDWNSDLVQGQVEEWLGLKN